MITALHLSSNPASFLLQKVIWVCYFESTG